MPDRRPSLPFPVPGGRRAVVVGAGSFGTAVAVLLMRAGLRTTLVTRTAEQARTLNAAREDEHARPLNAARENDPFLPGVELPRDLRVEASPGGLARADLVFLAVPSRG